MKKKDETVWCEDGDGGDDCGVEGDGKGGDEDGGKWND